MKTMRKDVQVGIYDDAYVARIYANKIITTAPYVRWVGQTGYYAERKQAIRDQAVVDAVLADLRDGAIDSAWMTIGQAIGDDWLAQR